MHILYFLVIGPNRKPEVSHPESYSASFGVGKLSQGFWFSNGRKMFERSTDQTLVIESRPMQRAQNRQVKDTAEQQASVADVEEIEVNIQELVDGLPFA